MASFDPYHIWLGIPPEEQPPNHYRLLGISELESNPDVIDTAAERQTLLLRTFQTGDQAQLAEQLLNEVSAARVCLLDGKAKARYDKRLKAELDSAAGSAALANISLAVESGSQRDRGRRTGSSAPPAWYQTPWATAGAGAVVMLLLMLLFWPSGADTKDPGKTGNSQSQQQIDALKQKLAAAERAAKVPSGNTTVSESSPLLAAARAAMDKAASEKAITESVVTLKGHTSDVYTVSFSPDGRRIVSGSVDTTVKVWDAENGHEMLTLTGHSNTILELAFSPDGKRIVSASKASPPKVWNAETGQIMGTFYGHSDNIRSVAYSPDGKRLVSGSYDGTVKLWDSETGRIVLTLIGHSGLVPSVVFSPDGKRIVSGSHDNTIKVWDSVTSQEIRTLKGHSSPVYSVAFSPDGRRIVSGSNDKTLRVWDAETGQEILTLKGHSSPVYSVAFSPDGRRIVSGSDDTTVKVWDAETGRIVLTLIGHLDEVRSVAFSPDGKRIVSGSHDNTVKIWNLGPVPAQPATRSLPASLQEGLVAYYPFNGNAKDESGNGNDGTVHGASLSDDRHGTPNQAYLFDGVDDYIQIKDDPSLKPLSSLSVSVWANYRSRENRSWDRIVSKDSSDSQSGIGAYQIFMGGGTDFGEIGLYLTTVDEKIFLTRSSKIDSSETNLPPEQWHLVIGVWNGRFAKVYHDSELAYGAPINGTLKHDNDPLLIGKDQRLGNFFEGSIDDIRIYNRALSEAEVKALYEYEKP